MTQSEVYNEESEVRPKPALNFRPLDQRQADDLFTALPHEQKWSDVIGTLLSGAAVFVPNMTRNQLESLRTIINRRTYGRLRSRTTVVDDQSGRVLRVQQRGQPVAKSARVKV